MDEYISREAVINITAETGAWETQNRVRELPAADVQPVKHGRWISTMETIESEFVKCSNCQSEYYIQDLQHVENLDGIVNFCPNCGSKNEDGDSDGR